MYLCTRFRINTYQQGCQRNFWIVALACTYSLHQAAPSNAQMAESVDALVSNTNAARRAGSTPALGTFQNNSKSRKQLILRHLRDFLFYNNPLFAPHLLHKSILTFFLAVFLTVIRKLTVIAFMKYLNIPSLRKTRLVSIHGNSNLNVCSSND